MTDQAHLGEKVLRRPLADTADESMPPLTADHTSRLLVSPGCALFLGDRIEEDVGVHHHHLMKIFISLDRTFCLLYKGEWNDVEAVVIAPDVPHRFKSVQGAYAVVYLDGESEAAFRVRRECLGGRALRFLPATTFATVNSDLRRLRISAARPEQARELSGRIVQCLCISKGPPPSRMDDRVHLALALLSRCDDKKTRVGEIARQVHLSEGRLIHLFTRQVGIPIRRYLLWLRLLDAVNQIMDGSSFTTAAHEAGFSDSAHLSRTFRAMFGLSLIDVFTTTIIAGSFKRDTAPS